MHSGKSQGENYEVSDKLRALQSKLVANSAQLELLSD
jgi:hypothetical protein